MRRRVKVPMSAATEFAARWLPVCPADRTRVAPGSIQFRGRTSSSTAERGAAAGSQTSRRLLRSMMTLELVRKHLLRLLLYRYIQLVMAIGKSQNGKLRAGSHGPASDPLAGRIDTRE